MALLDTSLPVLAMSGASLIISALNKAQKTWKLPRLSVSKKRLVKISAGLLVCLTLIGIIYSTIDAYSWVAKDQTNIPIQEATDYAATHLSSNESIIVLCPQNLFSMDIVQFYLSAQGKNNLVLQYPLEPVDVYTPNFNITDFVQECRQNNVKYVFTYEYGGDVPYFNTTLSAMGVYASLYESGKFQYLSGNNMLEDLVKQGLIPAFGTDPRRVFILTFIG